MNCESGNDSIIFLSEIIRISISEVTSDTNVSNLFRIGLIFIWVTIGFWGYFKRNVLKPWIMSSLFSVVFSEELASLFFLWFWVSILSQFLWIEDRKFSARMEKPTEFRCKPSRCKCLWVMLLCVISSIPCFFSLFLKFSLLFFAFSLSVRTVGDESVIIFTAEWLL